MIVGEHGVSIAIVYWWCVLAQASSGPDVECADATADTEIIVAAVKILNFMRLSP
jgi:hypothetical protein